MSRRRKRILIAAVLVVVLAALAWWLVPGGGRMEVKLVFLGYTNVMLTNITTVAAPLRTNAIQVQQAMVMITNSGETPVKVWFARSPAATVLMGAEGEVERAIWFPEGYRKDTLAPGTGMVLLSQPNSFLLPWTVELQVWRNYAQDRLYWQRLRPQAIQNLLQGVLSRPPSQVAKLGLVTRLPPQLTNRPPDKLRRQLESMDPVSRYLSPRTPRGAGPR